MSIDMMLQNRAIFIIGVYGEDICLLSDQAEISFLVFKFIIAFSDVKAKLFWQGWLYKKRSHIMKVSVRKKTSNKKNYHQKAFDKLI